jgi:hypothetical protein
VTPPDADVDIWEVLAGGIPSTADMEAADEAFAR